MKKMFLSIIGLVSVAAAHAYTTTTSETLRVWYEFPDHVIADGKTVNYIKVYEHDDANIDYTAFNMEFILPEGFQVNRVKKGRETVDDIFLSERATSTHSIACKLNNGIDLRIIADSNVNENLFTDDEDGNPLDLLFTVGLIADPSLTSGEYTVRLEGIKFVIRNGDACIPANEPITQTILVDGTAAIDSISPDEIDPDDCYDLLGRKIDPSKATNNIIITKGRKFIIRR